MVCVVTSGCRAAPGPASAAAVSRCYKACASRSEAPEEGVDAVGRGVGHCPRTRYRRRTRFQAMMPKTSTRRVRSAGPRGGLQRPDAGGDGFYGESDEVPSPG